VFVVSIESYEIKFGITITKAAFNKKKTPQQIGLTFKEA
jgi:hypothetical protein